MTGPPRRILVCTSYFEPGFRGGGPVRSLARMLDTAPDDTLVTVVTRDRDLGADRPYPGLSGHWVQRGRHRVFHVSIRSLRLWLRLLLDLRGVRFELLYVNSLWSPLFTVLPILAARGRLVKADGILIAPRGELSPGALALKSRKKRVALRFWAPVLRRSAVRWHATATDEAADIRTALPWADVVVASNQTGAGPEPSAPPQPRTGPLSLIFISRISPKKNLRAQLEALLQVTGQVGLDIYGPVEDRQYWATCTKIIDRMPANVTVRYRGTLLNEQVAETFQRYDAFCFPTLGENFGHVIAESLSASCPVICSDLTPWSEVLNGGGGYVLADLSPSTIATVIDSWARLEPEDRHQRRLAAGAAYARWATDRDGANLFDVVRPRTRGAGADGGPRTVALVTQGFATGGGVPQVARWLRASLEATGEYRVEQHDLATSRRDRNSRRLLAPRTWLRTSLQGPTDENGVRSWGANGVEVEPLRYRPRRELTDALNQYDIVQVVAGGPALAAVTRGVQAPVVLHFATRAKWERPSQQEAMNRAARAWRKAMTAVVDRIEHRALRSVDAVLAQNHVLRDHAAQVARGPALFAAPGVDTDRFRPHPDGVRASGHLLSVCRLADPRKGLLRLVQAYGTAVSRDGTTPDLLLVGKGELSSPVVAAIERLALQDRVRILRDVAPADLPDLYRRASVFVQGSYEEGFGISVAEAMACGLPVVCTDTAGTRETVVDGETGWVIDQAHDERVSAQMADAIRAALGDEGARRGAAGRSRCVELLADERTVGKVTSLYEALTVNRRRATTSA